MEKVIQNLTKILKKKKKINLYVELFDIPKSYVTYKREKLLRDLIDFYIISKYDENKTFFKGYEFTEKTFNFDTKFDICCVERIFIKNYINI